MNHKKQTASPDALVILKYSQQAEVANLGKTDLGKMLISTRSKINVQIPNDYSYKYLRNLFP